MRTRLALSLVLVSLVACTKDDVAPDRPPQPADVIAVASVRSLTDAVGRIRAYVEAIMPGAGAAVSADAVRPLLGQAIGAESLDGVALDKPLHLIVLDPKKHARPFVLLAHADPAKLRPGAQVTSRAEGGAALLGEKAAVDLCAAWALRGLTKEEAPESFTVRASLRVLFDLYRADIEKTIQVMDQVASSQGQGMGRLLSMEVDLLGRLAVQTEEMQLVMDASAEEAWMELRLKPTAGSLFEAFNQAQRPSSIGLLPRLSGTPRATMLMIGEYRLGPIRDALYELVGSVMAGWAGVKFDAEFGAKWNAFMDHFQGPVAMSMGQAGSTAMNLQQVATVDDGPATAAAARAIVPKQPTTVDLFGVTKLTLSTREAVATHDGIAIDELTGAMDYSTMPELQRQTMQAIYGDGLLFLYAGFDKYFVMTMGKTALAEMQQTIDLLRRGPDAALPPGAKPALDAGVGRKSTLVMFMNMAASMSAITGRTIPATSGMNTEVSFPDGKALMRIGMPAAHVREIQSAFVPPN
jgi:hypothetical protein